MARLYWASIRVLGAALLMVVVAGILGGCQSAQRQARAEGLAAYKSKDYTAAFAKFNEALSHDEFSAIDNYYAGNAAFQLGKLKTAEGYYMLAWQADPSMAEVKAALTETLLRQGKTDEALDLLERDSKMLEAVKDHHLEKLRNNRVYVWAKEDRMYAQKASSRVFVAQTYERIGDLDNARVFYEQARKLAPDDPTILLAVGEFYGRLGKKAEAQDALIAAYHIDPQTPGLVEAMTRNGIFLNDVIRQ